MSARRGASASATSRSRIGQGQRSGKLVAEFTEVSKSFDEKTIVKDLDLIVSRGDRLGLVGPNGAGKTTLLGLILGTLAPDSGGVRLGTNVQVAYFDQMREVLDPEKTVAETISPGADWVRFAGRPQARDELPRRLPVPAAARELEGVDALRRRAQSAAARATVRQARERAGAGRADQRPRHRVARAARGRAAGLRGHHPARLHDRAFLDNVVTSDARGRGRRQMEGVRRRL